MTESTGTKPLVSRRDFLNFGLFGAVSALSMLIPNTSNAAKPQRSSEIVQGYATETTIQEMEKKHSVQLTRVGEVVQVTDLGSQEMFKKMEMAPQIEGIELSPDELQLIDSILDEVPYLNRLVDRITIARNNFPAIGPFAALNNIKPGAFNGLTEPANPRVHLVIFRPECLPPTLTKQCLLNDPVNNLPEVLFNNNGMTLTLKEIYREIMFHEIGHAIQNYFMVLSAENADQYVKWVDTQNNDFPLMNAYAKALGVKRMAPGDLQSLTKYPRQRGPIRYSAYGNNLVIEGANWKLQSTTDEPLPPYMARLSAVPDEDLRQFPPRTLFGSLVESFADYYSYWKRGIPPTSHTKPIWNLMKSIEQVLETNTETTFLSGKNDANAES